MSQAPISRRRRALDALNKAIAEGAEYPDAEWRISQEFVVSPDHLRKLYDEQDRSSFDHQEASRKHQALNAVPTRDQDLRAYRDRDRVDDGDGYLKQPDY